MTTKLDFVDVDAYPGVTDFECPTCGAEPGQQCMVSDPDDPGFSIEISSHVHWERAED